MRLVDLMAPRLTADAAVEEIRAALDLLVANVRTELQLEPARFLTAKKANKIRKIAKRIEAITRIREALLDLEILHS